MHRFFFASVYFHLHFLLLHFSPQNGLSAHCGGGGGGGMWWWLEARNTGSHCGGHATGWLSDCLFILLGAVVCEIRSAQKTEAKPMMTSARELNPPLIACSLR